MIDSNGKLVINLSGIPRPLLKAFQPKASAHENKFRNGLLLGSAQVETGLVSADRVHEKDMKAGAASENGRGSSLLHAYERAKQLTDEQPMPKSDLAKKVRLRVKKVQLPAKPKLVVKKNDTLEVKQSNLEVRRVEAAREELAISKDTDSIAEPEHTSVCEGIHRSGNGDVLRKSSEVSVIPNMGTFQDFVDPQNVSAETADKVDHDNSSMAPANRSFALTDGYVADKGYSKIQPTFVEDATRENISKEYKDYCSRRKHSARAKEYLDMTAHDDTASKEQTILETLLPDEPPGFSSAEGSQSRHSEESERVYTFSGESEESERSDEEYTQSEGSDSADTDSCPSQESEGADTRHLGKHLSPGTPGRGTHFTDQVPSVLCDAEGNVWHVGKRAEKAREHGDLHSLSPSETMAGQKLTSAQDSLCDEVQVCELKSPPAPESAPSPIPLNWKWNTDAGYTSKTLADMNNRSVVVKERSVFVGLIPDGVVNLEEILEDLMKKFLERFDFVPAILSKVLVVKVLKDFAFVELATDKVAQIVLAANQLDVFEWAINGSHINIQGCNGTRTSVRPLIEYMPLKPARVIFIGNIPKSHWEKDYLEAFFSRILQGSDGSMDLKVVVSVYLLPESCDAYLELASEFIADALIYKCTRNSQILKDIGEDAFICRDASSPPMMSRHTSVICPQRSLFVGISSRGEDFKVDYVRKAFEEVLLSISRKSNHRGYLEYISFQPGTDYAFFQINSEATVDAIMDEYIENTHLFICQASPVLYIILRPPDYVRPGARYYLENNWRGQSKCTYSGYDHGLMKKGHLNQGWRIGERQPDLIRQGLSRSRSNCIEEPGKIALKTGEEPRKKPDCVISIGVSPPPLASWNGVSSEGDCSADPDCLIIVEGLAKGLSYKLLRGALNELFERALSHTGLLEVGMLVLRYLDRDENHNTVACLPSADFVYALLSMRKVFMVAGNEIRLLPKNPRKIFNRRWNPSHLACGQGEHSCLSDEDAYLGRRPFRGGALGKWNAPIRFQEKNRLCSETKVQYHHSHGALGRGFATRRNDSDLCTAKWGQNEGLRSISPQPRQEFRGHFKETLHQWNGAEERHRNWNGLQRHGINLPIATTENSPWQGSDPGGKAPKFFKKPEFQNRSTVQANEAGMTSGNKIVNGIGIRVPVRGVREFRTGGKTAGKGKAIIISSRKRRRMEAGQGGPMQKLRIRKGGFMRQQEVSNLHFP